MAEPAAVRQREQLRRAVVAGPRREEECDGQQRGTAGDGRRRQREAEGRRRDESCAERMLRDRADKERGSWGVGFGRR